MLKKSITYENPFTGQSVTEEHYFHISKADLVEMEMEEHKSTYTKDGVELTGAQAKIQRIIDSEDGKAIMTELKDWIRRSYGKKVGERFVKNDETWQEFAGSEAYSQLIFELCTNAEKASEFMNGVIPNNLEEIAAQVAAETNGGASAADVIKDSPAAGTGPRVITQSEAREMTQEELSSGLAEGRYVIKKDPTV